MRILKRNEEEISRLFNKMIEPRGGEVEEKKKIEQMEMDKK